MLESCLDPSSSIALQFVSAFAYLHPLLNMMAFSSVRKDYCITDLRNPFQTDGLGKRIGESLTSSPKSLPSLLLWDERGHQLFEAITKSKDYYGTAADKEILFGNIESVCDMIGDGGYLLELGSGSVFH